MFPLYSPKKNKTYTVKEALLKAASFCAYQERTQNEVRSKLYTYGLEEDEVEVLIIKLCAEKMIDEERFAQSYVRGKYGIKKWGRRKILQGLKAKGISDYCIKKGMQEIDFEVYDQNLRELLEKKQRTEKEKNPFARRQKISYYLQSKGYEADLVADLLKETE